MRESVGNVFILNFITIFITIFVLFLVGTVAYSKAFKVKGLIIEVIEKRGTFDNAREEINESLRQIGYRVWQNRCPDIDNAVNLNNQNNGYDYCVYRVIDGDNNSQFYRGDYYKVIAFITFDFPIISEAIRIPVSGETKNLR